MNRHEHWFILYECLSATSLSLLLLRAAGAQIDLCCLGYELLPAWNTGFHSNLTISTYERAFTVISRCLFHENTSTGDYCAPVWTGHAILCKLRAKVPHLLRTEPACSGKDVVQGARSAYTPRFQFALHFLVFVLHLSYICLIFVYICLTLSSYLTSICLVFVLQKTSQSLLKIQIHPVILTPKKNGQLMKMNRQVLIHSYIHHTFIIHSSYIHTLIHTRTDYSFDEGAVPTLTKMELSFLRLSTDLNLSTAHADAVSKFHNESTTFVKFECMEFVLFIRMLLQI